MFKNKIIKKEIEWLRDENNLLRQSVPPEKQKYLPPKIEKLQKKEAFKDFIEKDFKKHTQVLGIIGLVAVIAIVFIVEIIILNKNAAAKEEAENKEEEKTEEDIQEPIPENTETLFNTIGNSSANIINDGIFAEQNDWLYYSNSNDNYFLYKMKKNGNTDEKRRINAEPCYQINITGDTAYYLNYETRAFYSVKTDGSNIQRINMLSCLNILIADNFIYYTAFSDGSLHKMNIDGSNDIDLSGELKNPLFFIYGDEVYYTDKINNSLIRASDKKALLPGYINNFLLIGENLYYINDNIINVYNMNTGEQTVINNIRAKSLNATAENIIYQSADNSRELYSVKNNIADLNDINPPVPKLLVNDFKTSLNAVSEHVCYQSIDGNYYLLYNINEDVKRILIE